MARVTIDNLTPGMKLQRPLMNTNGVVVLRENTELTGALIGKMQKMGIEAADVQGAAVARPPRDEALACLDRRFKNVETAAHMAVIKKLLREHIESLYDHGPENAEE